MFVYENTPSAVGDNIAHAQSISDPNNDVLTYSLSGEDAHFFDFDTATAQIKAKILPLDYETKNEYSVTVNVTDGKDPWAIPTTQWTVPGK